MLSNLLSLLIEFNDNNNVLISFEEFGEDGVYIYAEKALLMLNSIGLSCDITYDKEGACIYKC